MTTNGEIQYTKLADLSLDAKNPRLDPRSTNETLSQEDILDLMRDDWALDELVVSYLESGFWTHEALLVIEEALNGQSHLVVVEGNRRLAALKCLYAAFHREQGSGQPISKKWRSLVENGEIPDNLFDRIPYIQVDSREDVEAFLGFRHVTGVKQWPPKQKARYIAKLIDERDMSYEEVMRKIGSTTPTVRTNYISYQLLLQMESTLPDFSPKHAENRFSVMYLTLRKEGVQHYLQIDILADPETAKPPVPKDHIKNLSNFARWLFGNDDHPPLFEDSRQAEKFNASLESPEARQYLEESKDPKLEHAFQLAGGDELETTRFIHEASNSIALSLSHVHHHKDSQKVQFAVEKLSGDFKALLNQFPKLKKKFLEED